jgi:hypothetical protein
MKTKSNSLSALPHRKTTIGSVLEWTVLLALLVFGVFLFLKGFGFISVNDVQAFAS